MEVISYMFLFRTHDTDTLLRAEARWLALYQRQLPDTPLILPRYSSVGTKYLGTLLHISTLTFVRKLCGLSSYWVHNVHSMEDQHAHPLSNNFKIHPSLLSTYCGDSKSSANLRLQTSLSLPQLSHPETKQISHKLTVPSTGNINLASSPKTYSLTPVWIPILLNWYPSIIPCGPWPDDPDRQPYFHLPLTCTGHLTHSRLQTPDSSCQYLYTHGNQ